MGTKRWFSLDAVMPVAAVILPAVDPGCDIKDRPTIGDRPVTLPGDITNRPGIGIGNRPGWGFGPGWGLGPGWGFRPGWGHRPGWGWGNQWFGNHVHYHHHTWYHGCWSGNWGAPLVWGATAWGMNALLPSWGFTYTNPYYVGVSEPVYDYSKPIVVNTHNVIAADDTAESSDEPSVDESQI
jgi:hypothetical protein